MSSMSSSHIQREVDEIIKKIREDLEKACQPFVGKPNSPEIQRVITKEVVGELNYIYIKGELKL